MSTKFASPFEALYISILLACGRSNPLLPSLNL